MGQTVQALDVVMQEFKARTMAIKDGGWHAAQWLALIPVDAEPCAASRSEETTARRVAHAELRREELRTKLAAKKSHF